MKTSVFIDTQRYEFVKTHNLGDFDKDHAVEFHSRHELESFISKAFNYDASVLQQLNSDPTIAPYDTAKLLEAIVGQIEKGEVIILQGHGGGSASSGISGGAPTGIPNSIPEVNDLGSTSQAVDRDLMDNLSDRYSNDMKRFIAAHQGNYNRFGGIKPEFLNRPAPGPIHAKSENASIENSDIDSDSNNRGYYENDNESTIPRDDLSNNLNTPNTTAGNTPSNSSQLNNHQNTATIAPAKGTTPRHLSPSTLPPIEQQDLRYKIIVEIAGRHPCAKQLIEINALSNDKSAPREYQAQQNRGVNHNRDNHRGIVEFKKLPNTPRDIAIIIPTKGYGANIRLPLNTTLIPNDNQTEKTEWDTVLVPVKPLAYVTKAKQRQQADVLKPGWIYIFWRGKLWRECQVKKNQALSDVNVEYYRRNWNGDLGQDSDREAEGHWQSAAWVPYKLNGEIQTDNNAPLMMYSESQLDWPYIESLEVDNSKLLETATALDLTAYSQDNHYKNASGDMGSIENALLDQTIDPEEHQYQVISEKGKDLRGYRDTRVPVVYLQPQGDFFMLEVMDEDGRPVKDTTFALAIGDKEFEGQLDHKGMLKFSVPEGIPNGEGHIKIWADGDDAEPESVPFKVKADTLADVSTIEGIQARCNNLGFDAGVVDGINGKKTKAAVKAFQSNNTLSVDGIAGPKTQKKLKKVYKR